MGAQSDYTLTLWYSCSFHPHPHPKLFHSRLTHNDTVRKMKMKNYVDQTRHTRDSEIRTGDHVLANQRKRNKLTPLYDSHPYTVVKKRGSLIVAIRGNHFVTRNSSFFKPVQIAFLLKKKRKKTLMRQISLILNQRQ